MATGGYGYSGERLTKGGRFETKKFTGSRGKVLLEWAAWQEEVADEAFIRDHRAQVKQASDDAIAEVKVERLRQRSEGKKKEDEVAQQKQEPQKKEQRFMYLLAFQGQRSSKGVAVFERMEDAIDMSDALTVALDANNIEGKYTVEELPIWGGRG